MRFMKLYIELYEIELASKKQEENCEAGKEKESQNIQQII